MKSVIKRVAIVIMLFVMTFAFASCMHISEEEWAEIFIYNYAIIELPDGSIEKISIKEWYNANNGRQFEIIAEDGNRYLVNSDKCVLVKE